MLDMGFAPDIKSVVSMYGLPEKTDRQTLMFSATFPEEVQKMARDFLNDYLFITIGRVGGANTDIEQTIYNVPKREKRDKIKEILDNQRKPFRMSSTCSVRYKPRAYWQVASHTL